MRKHVIAVMTLSSLTFTAAISRADDSKSVIPKSLGPYADTFLDIGDKFSNAKDAIELATILGTYLGIFSQSDPNAPFEALKSQVQLSAMIVDWKNTMLFIDNQRGAALWAMDRLARAGSLAEGSNEDQSSGTAVDAVAGDSAFTRPYNPHATDGDPRWKLVFREMNLAVDPPTSNGLVYDWRLGVPALIELIAYRLNIIAGMDSNFRWNNRYDAELTRLRDVLLGHYNKMLAGIQCTYQSVGPNNSLGDGHVCADIYTGQSAIFSLTPHDPPHAVVFARLTSQIRQSMPLFQMRAMIDMLNLYISGAADLTSVTGDIRMMAAQSQCVSLNGDLSQGQNPFQTSACDWSNNQWWTFDRNTHLITNPSNGWCLDVQNADSIDGTPVWNYWCNGTNAQLWTWDPNSGVLLNAIGTALTVVQNNGQSSIVTMPNTVSISQQWTTPPSGCPNLCSAGGTPMPSGCGTCTDQVSNADPFCSNNAWDSICVGEVTSICGLKC